MVDGSTNVLAIFHAKACAHCKALLHELNAVAGVLTASDDHDLTLVAVDADAHPGLAHRFGIKAFPVFKWFHAGTAAEEAFYFVHYGGRMGDTLMKLIGERLPSLSGRALPPEKNYVETITTDSFIDFIVPPKKRESSPGLLYVHAPWGERDDHKRELQVGTPIVCVRVVCVCVRTCLQTCGSV